MPGPGTRGSLLHPRAERRPFQRTVHGAACWLATLALKGFIAAGQSAELQIRFRPEEIVSAKLVLLTRTMHVRLEPLISDRLNVVFWFGWSCLLPVRVVRSVAESQTSGLGDVVPVAVTDALRVVLLAALVALLGALPVGSALAAGVVVVVAVGVEGIAVDRMATGAGTA